MTQKVHKNGKGDIRYFWNVRIAGSDAGEYRSRHGTTEGVRKELKKYGHRVKSVTPVIAHA